MGMTQAQQALDWEWDYNVKSAKCMMMSVECFHLRLKEVWHVLSCIPNVA